MRGTARMRSATLSPFVSHSSTYRPTRRVREYAVPAERNVCLTGLATR